MWSSSFSSCSNKKLSGVEILFALKILSDLSDKAGEIEAESWINIRIALPEIILLHAEEYGMGRLPVSLQHRKKTANIILPNTEKQIDIILHRIEAVVEIGQISSFHPSDKVGKPLKLIPEVLQFIFVNYHMRFLSVPGPKVHHCI